MNIKFQGLLFSVVAWASLIAMGFLPPFSIEAQLLLVLPIILFIGVPHGALDIVFARQFIGVRSISGWILFTLAYVTSAALVFCFWWIAPGFFLESFLLISVFHFAGDPDGKASAIFRILYGGSVIFCPLLLHEVAVLEVYSYLAGNFNAKFIVALLKWAALPWVIAIGIVVIEGVKREPDRSFELVSVTALLTLAPPLLGFTLFFCGMHGARHMIRTRDYSCEGNFFSLLRIAFWPMTFTVVGVGIALWLSEGSPLSTRITQILFVGLAALTVPHMILIEQVRLTNWMAGRRISNASLLDL